MGTIATRARRRAVLVIHMVINVSMENELRGLVYDVDRKINNYDDHHDIISLIEAKLAYWKRMETSSTFCIKSIEPPKQRDHKKRAGLVIAISPDSPHYEKVAEYY